jgi:hypothetical protein
MILLREDRIETIDCLTCSDAALRTNVAFGLDLHGVRASRTRILS